MTSPTSLDPEPKYHEYLAWDVPTRWFHWINALAVIGLMATGIVILSDDALGISAAGKVLLKSIHVSFGYVMAVNLLWRLAGSFEGQEMPGPGLRPFSSGPQKMFSAPRVFDCSRRRNNFPFRPTG